MGYLGVFRRVRNAYGRDALNVDLNGVFGSFVSVSLTRRNSLARRYIWLP